jgi:hypothetical protein
MVNRFRHAPTLSRLRVEHRIVVTKTLICLKDLAWPNP